MPDYKTFGFTPQQVIIRDNVLWLPKSFLSQQEIADFD